MKDSLCVVTCVLGAACAKAPGPLGPVEDAGVVNDAGEGGPHDLRDAAAVERDAEPQLAEVTCQSGDFWLGGDIGSERMNPGLACRSCHARNAPELAYFFAGTVFGSLHEQDLCNSPPPEGARIEILNEAGDVALTLSPNAVGNFISHSREPGFPLPYRARVVVGERARTMQTLQYSGDCNLCHTEQGAQGALGRMTWPSE